MPLNFSKLFNKLVTKWKVYRHRFFPWVALKLIQNRKKAILRTSSVDQSSVNPLIREKEIENFCHSLSSIELSAKNEKFIDCDTYKQCLKRMESQFGFIIERSKSCVEGCGQGVKLKRGVIPANTLVALYPGLIYIAGEPLFFQSIMNTFMFRCGDQITIDGNDKSLSKFLFRSCAYRDRIGTTLPCDITWLTDYPKNPLSVGQYINNCNNEHPANVKYCEHFLTSGFSIEACQFLPYNFYSSLTPMSQRKLKIIYLESLRVINEGEELFSNYYTLIGKQENEDHG